MDTQLDIERDSYISQLQAITKEIVLNSHLTLDWFRKEYSELNISIESKYTNFGKHAFKLIFRNKYGLPYNCDHEFIAMFPQIDNYIKQPNYLFNDKDELKLLTITYLEM